MREIKDLKNQGKEILLENDEVNFEEVEEWGDKYHDAVTRYHILMDEIEVKLRSFKEMEKIECARSGRKTNGVDNDGDIVAYEEERRRESYKIRFSCSES